MAICGAVSVTAFSRELRRRMGQSRRTGREFVPPGAKSPRPRVSCCLLLLLIVVALIAYAYLEGYVLRPRREKAEQSLAGPLAPEICSRAGAIAQIRSANLPVQIALRCPRHEG